MPTNQSIPEQLNIFQYSSYQSIPPGKLAWITIKAKQQGKDPKMVHAGIKAKMSRKNYKPTSSAKTTRKRTTKKQQSIYEQLNLSDYKSYDSIPPAKRAWITIKAKREGKDPDKVHSQIAKKMGGSKKVGKKVSKKKVSKGVGKKKKKIKIDGCPSLIISTDKDIDNWSFKNGITRSLAFKKKGLAEFAVNVGPKCDNNCLYCFSGSMLFRHRSFKEFKRDPHAFGYAIVDPEISIKVAKDATRKRWDGARGLIELSTYSDAWCPSARKLDLGRKCLKAVLENDPKWTIRVLTKNHEVEKDFDIIKKYRKRVSVSLTVTSPVNKSKIMQVVEQNASPVKERIRVLKKAHRMGLRTYMMLCPLLPSIADGPKQIDWYIQLAEEVGAEEVFAEAVNSRGETFPLVFKEFAKKGYKNEAKAIKALMDDDIHSEYTLRLVKNVQKSMRKYSNIRKLRFLLYSNKLLSEHLKEIQKDDAGIKWL